MLRVYLFLYLIDLLDSILSFFFFFIFLFSILVPLLKNLVYSKEYLPENTLNQCSDDIDNDDMHEAEITHDVSIKLRIFPRMVEGDHRPPCFSEDLNHYILSLNKATEGRVLSVHLITVIPFNGIGIVENLHSDDCKDKEEEHEKRHEL